MSSLFVVAATMVAVAGPSASRADTLPPLAEGVDYRVYTGSGEASSLLAILSSLDAADVLLVGEAHDDMRGHAVELALLQGAVGRFDPEPGTVGRRRAVLLSMEMFETDVQHVVDEYLADLITEEHFLASARPWDHYERRYRPILEAAREMDVPVRAANAPRRYVNRVTRLGPESLDALPQVARSFLPPLPYPSPSEAYRAQFEEVMAEAREAMREASDSAEEGAEPPEHSTEGALQAQALWDAAMGYSVANALEGYPGGLVVHLAGSFHVKWGTGVPERIAGYRPAFRTVTVVMEPVSDVDGWSEEAHRGLADFVVLTLAEADDESER